MSDADRIQLLARLDVEPCTCPLEWEQHEDGDDPDAWHLVPCPHVLAAPRHSLSLRDWAELQRLLCPADYADPPEPEAPAIALTAAARVEVYSQRQGHKMHLYHDRDLWRKDEGRRRVGVQAVRAPNGAALDGGLNGSGPLVTPLLAMLLAECGLTRRLFDLGRQSRFLPGGRERKRLVNALTRAERTRLAALETIVAAGLDSFYSVGKALMEIKAATLYRAARDVGGLLPGQVGVRPRPRLPSR